MLLGLVVAGYASAGRLASAGRPPHVHELITADAALLGWWSGGRSPVVWLQSLGYEPGVVRWWDVLACLVYASHFVAVMVVPLGLYLWDRDLALGYVRMWLVLALVGVAVYLLYPAAPPWWAARAGLIPAVSRISTHGWQGLNLPGVAELISSGQGASNPIGAMPSLHAGAALLAAVFFAPLIRRRWWPLLLLYPVSMALTLMYTGEHWFVDILAGWAAVPMAYALVAWWDRLVPAKHDAPLSAT
ncbi:phosphatase PAP2 family protein [Nocardiopsis gilva]|uniref:phosphatase PAP2 family protein n=1 Tax=Nocardiopsis gilva TaxID=280236 RepID=UPI0003467BAF|nr:phosphatase PAP2 family protein [Nocardiopsis gilva]